MLLKMHYALFLPRGLTSFLIFYIIQLFPFYAAFHMQHNFFYIGFLHR